MMEFASEFNDYHAQHPGIVTRTKGILEINLLLSLGLHFTMVIIAGVNYKNCPLEPNIPPFFLLEGSLGVVAKLIGIFKRYIKKCIRITHIFSFLVAIELVLFIVGSFYVFKTSEPDYSPTSGAKYCNKTIYVFTVIYICIYYVLLFVLIVAICYITLEILVMDEWVGEEDVENPSQVEE